MVKLITTLAALAATLTAVAAQEKIIAECGIGLGKCPSHKPCCSQYGLCGIGAYCLGGCDPIFSTTIDSCVPAPVCQSKKSTFENLNKVVSNFKYLGDATKHDWVAEGKPVGWNNNLLLTMEKGSVGTVLSSTRYVWYGKIGATLKTSRGAGVVSAFILFSGVKDEIDYEWVGVDLGHVQTNYYFQGIPDYTKGGESEIGGNTFENYHNYEIDWTPEHIKWYIDGSLVRTVNKKDTWNSTSKIYHYPQTPSRVQLSLWPGGAPTNAEGTIEWAGGPINWDHPDIQRTGYYYVTVKDISIQCYNPPSGARKEGSKSYVFTDEAGLESSVVISDQSTVLKSMLGTGTDMNKTPDDLSEDEKLDEVETVPGNVGGGTSADDLVEQVKGGDESGGTGGQYDTGSGGWDQADATTDFIQPEVVGGDGQTGDAGTMGTGTGSVMALVVVAVGMGVLL